MSSAPQETEGLVSTMAHPAYSTTLSEDELDLIQATADAWRSRGYGRTADNLLTIAGLSAPIPQPSTLPSNVYQLADRRSCRQAVS